MISILSQWCLLFPFSLLKNHFWLEFIFIPPRFCSWNLTPALIFIYTCFKQQLSPQWPPICGWQYCTTLLCLWHYDLNWIKDIEKNSIWLYLSPTQAFIFQPIEQYYTIKITINYLHICWPFYPSSYIYIHMCV